MRRYFIANALFFSAIAILYFCITIQMPVQAQFVLTESKYDCGPNSDIESTYAEQTSSSDHYWYDTRSDSSDSGLSVFCGLFIGVVGACAGCSIVLLVLVRNLGGGRVRYVNDAYLNAPPLPSRWYNSQSKSLLETVGK